MNTVEGTLDILWENCTQPTATPKYRLLFARYKNFKGGAQPSKHLVTADALESYLTEIGFMEEEAKNWIKQVSEKGSVSIPHTKMPEEHMWPYEQAS